MKKILTAILLLASIHVGYSQKFAKDIGKSNENIADPKKKDNPKTWIERAELMRKIYDEPTSKVTTGLTEVQLPVLLKGEDPLDTKEYVVDGETIKAIVYENKEIFLNSEEVIVRLRTTKTEIENPLDKAMEAYKKAAELGGDAKKIKEGLKALSDIYHESYAFGEYYVGNYAEAVEGFKKSLECSSHPAVGIIDTNTMYNVAFVAMKINDYKTAEEYYMKAADNGYVLGGDVYGSVYEAIRRQGTQNDTIRAGKMLTEAYEKYPESLNILGALINHYLGVGEDPKIILPILRTAQEAASNNASLFYVEGDLHKKLNDEESAIAAYEKAINLDKNLAVPYYHIGSIYAGRGDKLSDEANEIWGTNSAKAAELENKARDEYKKAVDYFEQAFKNDPDEPAFAEILKRVYYRLRYNGDEIDPEMQEKYNKYKDIADGME